MDYQQAGKLFDSARSKDAGKPLENNTRLHRRYAGLNKPDYAVRLHNTDIVTIHPDDTYTLNTGGWNTVTTKDRINKYAPGYVTQRQGIWYLTDGSLFEDGVVIDAQGHALSSTGDPEALEKAKREVDRLVREYIKGFVADIKENGLQDPSGGDCWCCADSDPMGLDHYFSHFEEKYYVSRLLWLALQRRGNPGFVWSMIQKGSPDIAIHDLRAYFRTRKLALAQMLVDRTA